MDNIERALHHIDRGLKDRRQHGPAPFEEFLRTLSSDPEAAARNIFQMFHNMIKTHVKEGADEYAGDPESIHFANYDCSALFVEGADNPFFADRLFANRLVNLVETLKRGTQQNKIYIFEGPHGSGKSTFLNNLLRKFEAYANTPEGSVYETVWRLDRKALGSFKENETGQFLDKLSHLLDTYEFGEKDLSEARAALLTEEDYIEIPCPSHDNPILMVPKEKRRAFFDDLFENDEAKWKLFTEKEYEWVFKDSPCTICSSLYQALLSRLKSPSKIYKMIYARPYHFNRRLGEGISVFSPGDKPIRDAIMSNSMLQSRINNLLLDSNLVQYIYSRYAKTNNGIYALMDIKAQNVDRLIELHNIISEGVHKVSDIEENVNSLLVAVMNPEDRPNIQEFQSFLDRVEYIKIPYVLDLNTEVAIYRNTFGKHIEESFLPMVLHNFARVIISSRLNDESEAMRDWIEDPEKYRLYCDEKLHLLKMEIYTGHIPDWLGEEGRKRLTAKRRKRIIAESETDGAKGFSGREAINIFNDFYSTYARKNKLITMSVLVKYFTEIRKDLKKAIPEGFLDSLLRMYNFTILQEVKESLYYYNEEQLSRDIQNYLFAVNFERGTSVLCEFTGERLKVGEAFLKNIEVRLLGEKATDEERRSLRKSTQKEYTARALTQEMMLEGKPITGTTLYRSLYERYVYHLKGKALDPFLDNENFRRAIKDYGQEAFKTYDKKIRDDVTFLMKNLCEKYGYSSQGAKEVCIYVIDSNLAREFSPS